jgi:hypothetical protein
MLKMKIHLFSFLILSLYFKLHSAQNTPNAALRDKMHCVTCKDNECNVEKLDSKSKWCGCGDWYCYV